MNSLLLALEAVVLYNNEQRIARLFECHAFGRSLGF